MRPKGRLLLPQSLPRLVHVACRCCMALLKPSDRQVLTFLLHCSVAQSLALLCQSS